MMKIMIFTRTFSYSLPAIFIFKKQDKDTKFVQSFWRNSFLYSDVVYRSNNLVVWNICQILIGILNSSFFCPRNMPYGLSVYYSDRKALIQIYPYYGESPRVSDARLFSLDHF